MSLLTRAFKNLGGWSWMIRRYGIVTTWRYEQARRDGVRIDYGKLFSPDELARLAEHSVPAPWEPGYPDPSRTRRLRQARRAA